MFKPKKNLKVISVIMIIIGILGMIVNIISYKLLSNMGNVPGIDTSRISQLNLVITLIGMSCCVLAGVFGMIGKSLKMAILFGSGYTLILFYNIVSNIINIGFSYVYFFNIIIPVLFWWGIYQSKE